ncbi:MAG: hypothetical protein NZM13_03480 [Cyclobacteriaceae bacterium]|nr:hypothetical protein [Cyclobacteriaceae bacterium]MDW8332479.1 hypothetical protein [Cyclobacteriaceae bacterium]
MKKTLPIKAYFNRARLFGYLLILILVLVSGYMLLALFTHP